MSEFGSGYVTCLWMFANHSGRLQEFVDSWNMTLAKDPSLAQDADWLDGVRMWANAASDHLYGLRRTRPNGVPKKEYRRARVIADFWLDIGHGYTRPRPPVTEARAIEDIAEAANLVILVCDRLGVDYPMDTEEAVAIDKQLGIKTADAGQWPCPTNLKQNRWKVSNGSR